MRVAAVFAALVPMAATAQPSFPWWPQTGRRLGAGVAQWVDPGWTLTTFDVICNNTNIGRVSIELGAVAIAKPTSPTVPVAYGAHVRMGFVRNGNDCCTPPLFQPPGVEYRWLQIVNTNTAGSSTPVVNQWFLDYDRSPPPPPPPPQGPFYSSRDRGRWGFTTGFDDTPVRPMPTAPDYVTWSAVSILVCVYAGEMNVLGAYSWGFNIFPNAGGLSVFGPQQTTLSAEMVNAIRADPSMANWVINTAGCCCVPAPSSAAVPLLAAATASRRRRRAA
ncbi:MAG: hypothetical protein JNJ48_06630 [Phycisphaerae bacterium]|nr:hypothetical protein [Phycisphaerae bacterium]